MKKQSNFPVLNSVLGIIALVMIAFFLNWLVSLSRLGSSTLDLTEAKVHTLTDGTKAILDELEKSEAEVVINYYATRDSDFMPREMELYMKKVDDFLKRYQALAGDNLRIVNLDPAPDTDAEDSANLDGIAGNQINGENIYLGISVSSLDQKATIPFLAPGAETQLEYQLSSAIAQVARTDRPTLGIMTPLPIEPGMMGMQMPGMPPQPPQQGYFIYQQLQQLYEVKVLTMEPTADDLEGLAALLVLHPAGITPESEFLLDQYVLGGGTVVAALDAFSIAAQSAGGANPMMGQQGLPSSSTFSDELLSAWGVEFESEEVVADGKFRTQLQQGASAAVLSLTKEAMPAEDSIITDGLSNLFFVLAGGFTKKETEGLAYQTLLRTSDEAALVDGTAASQLDQSLLTSARPIGKSFDLMLHVKGSFKTAFPEMTEATEEGEESTALTESAEPGNVFLIADVDFLSNNFAYSSFGGFISPQGDNIALLLNVLDQVTGSKFLIGSRSRGDSRRPFTVIQEMETDFEKEFGEKLEAEQAELDKSSERINELIAQQEQAGQISLEGDLGRELEAAREQQVEARKRLRELEKDLRSDKDALAARYTLANLLIMPIVVIVIGLIVYIRRRTATSAR